MFRSFHGSGSCSCRKWCKQLHGNHRQLQQPMLCHWPGVISSAMSTRSSDGGGGGRSGDHDPDPFDVMHHGAQRPVSDRLRRPRRQLCLPGASIVPVGRSSVPAPRESRLIRRPLADLVEPQRFNSEFPYCSDVCVLGGGLVGAAAAYFIGQTCWRGTTVALIDRDFGHQLSATAGSSGQLHAQHTLPEHVELATFSSTFLRHAHQLLATPDQFCLDVAYQPFGRLVCADQRFAHQQQEQQLLQQLHGVQTQLLSREQLAARYPWLNTGCSDTLAVANYCGESAGWYDPVRLTQALLARAERLGVTMVLGEVAGIERRVRNPMQVSLQQQQHAEVEEEETPGPEMIDSVLVRRDDGRIERTTASLFVLACGANSGAVAELADIGVSRNSLLGIPVPIQPVKRFTYRVHIPDGPGLDCPIVTSPAGVFLRRDGLHEQYICSCEPPGPQYEPDASSLHVDGEYFERHVRPALQALVPAAARATVLDSTAHLVDHNYFDSVPLLGFHPHYRNLFVATGFGDRAAQLAPGVGRAIYEALLCQRYRAVDLTRLGLERVQAGSQLYESSCG